MTGGRTSVTMSPGLLRVVKRAESDPDVQFNALAHLIDIDLLRQVYRKIDRKASAGIDGVSWQDYGRELEANLKDLHERLRGRRYRHQPIKRVNIPKGEGKTRPIGIPTMEDKIVQGALKVILEAVYEPIFLDCSYGYRPGRSAHEAFRQVDHAIYRGRMYWVLEADITSFFDSVNHSMLREMLQERVIDGSITRLIGKCLNAGVVGEERKGKTKKGTPQGSALSPILANIYLHHVLDLWFETQVRPRMRGKVALIRSADDFVICFEYPEDAKRVQGVLGKRLARYGLELHPEKTRLLDFRPPPKEQGSGKGSSTFDFLGMTVYWRHTRGGYWVPAFKTKRKSLRTFIRNVYEWCRRYRHLSIKDQHAELRRKIHGHYHYFGVNGNLRSLAQVKIGVERAWFKWLCRRSQRQRLTWRRFGDLLKDYPLPRPQIRKQLWRTAS